VLSIFVIFVVMRESEALQASCVIVSIGIIIIVE